MPYLDDNGNPIPTYLDDNGNPLPPKKKAAAPVKAGQPPPPSGTQLGHATQPAATVRTTGPISRFFGGLHRTTIGPAAGAVAGVGGYVVDHPIEATVGTALTMGAMPLARLGTNLFKGAQQGSQDEFTKMYQQADTPEGVTGRPAAGGLSGVGHAIAAGVPMIGPAVAPEVDRMFQGDVAGGAGGIAGMVAQMLLGNKIMGRLKGAPGEVPPADTPIVHDGSWGDGVTPEGVPVEPASSYVDGITGRVVKMPPMAPDPPPVAAAEPAPYPITPEGNLDHVTLTNNIRQEIQAGEEPLKGANDELFGMAQRIEAKIANLARDGATPAEIKNHLNTKVKAAMESETATGQEFALNRAMTMWNEELDSALKPKAAAGPAPAPVVKKGPAQRAEDHAAAPKPAGPPQRPAPPELPADQKAIHVTANANVAKQKLDAELAKPNPDPAVVEELNSQYEFYKKGGGQAPPPTPAASGAAGGAPPPARPPGASGRSAGGAPPTPPATPPAAPPLPPVRMTLGERTGSDAIKKAEGIVEGTFGGISPFKRFRAAQQGDIQDLGKAVAKGISGFEGSDEAVGQKFQADSRTALEGLKSSLNTEYGELDTMVGSRGKGGKFQKALQPSTALPKSFAKDALNQVKAESGLVSSSISKELTDILEGVAKAPDRMTFKAMAGARSTLAGIVRKKGIGALSDKAGGIVKKLVTTIDSAMEEAASKDPAILNKWRSLSARTKDLHDTFDRSAVSSMMDAAPEKVPGMIKGMSLEDIDRLHTVTPKETMGALQRRVVESIFDDATVGEAERHFLPEGVRELMGRRTSPDVKMRPDKLRKTLEDRYGIPKLERIFKDNPQGLKNTFKVLEAAERVGHTKGSLIGAIANFRILTKTGKALMTMDPTEMLEPAAIMASAKILSKLSTSTWGSNTMVEWIKASPGTAKYQFWAARMKEAVDKAERKNKEGKANSSPSKRATPPPSALPARPSTPSRP